jgi:1-deoxy-D-xylulose-5-phosphate reductoisomerase
LDGWIFETPDLKRFPALPLAYAAAESGGTAPAMMNAANEVAVNAFLSGRIRFTEIVAVVESVLAGWRRNSRSVTLSDVIRDDAKAREDAERRISRIRSPKK